MAIKLKLTARQVPWFLVAKAAAVCGAFLVLSPVIASMVAAVCLVIPRSSLRAYIPAVAGLLLLAFISIPAITKALVVIATLAILIHKEYGVKTGEWLQFGYYVACGAALTIWLQIPQPFLNPLNTISTTILAVWFMAVVWVLQQESESVDSGASHAMSLAAAIVAGGLIWQLLQVLVLLPLQPQWQLAIGFWGMVACTWFLVQKPWFQPANQEKDG